MGMHPEEIKASLRMNNYSLSMVADEFSVSPATITQVVQGKGKSKRIQARISEIIGVPVDRIWMPRKSLVRRKEVRTNG